MSLPYVDHKGVLVDKLGEDSQRFQLSCTFLKNNKGLHAIYEIRKLRQELLDFAKDPSIKQTEMDELRPREPNYAGMSSEDAKDAQDEYRQLMSEYLVAKTAMKMQVPIHDMFAIDEYMQPFEDTIHATPAVKGTRFHALTKDPMMDQQRGLFGLGKKQPQQ